MSQDFRDPHNPYSAPSQAGGPNPNWQPGQEYPGHCPRCGSTEFRQPSFTWWGGALGHKIISHVICSHCRKGFNPKTGGSNAGAITVYSLIVGAIFFVIFFLLFSQIW